ncbi:NAD(P)H-quinone oxidoreductase [Shewanella sp. Isolate8]|uniref:NAD(P)H-quinone oxidoreductase n=1 Tax=Shewanella sp. Isolate8 TaxID=2908529 RepID=UPI001EFE2407|nr:NAD(P)H-quinone oxidoreductase [Shewanella sp. Isolate8]MCG9745152.1 NAD(P)H-quinone oxidoreductase [Shewanella sp. Isolate8]
MSSLPTSYTHVQFNAPGGPEVLELTQSTLPAIAPDQLLIKVAYAGVNGPDVAQRRGVYPPPAGASEILGLEVSGTVVALGEQVTGWQLGDKVCALVPGGGYGEYVATWGVHCLPIPQGLSMAQAAALPETFFTVWGHMFMRGGLKAGETVLIHGGSGGIGSAAVTLAKQFAVKVLVTCGNQEKIDYCLALGADHGFNYHDEDLLAQIKAVAPQGVDLVLDMASGDLIDLNLKALAIEGRLVTIALQRGRRAEVDVALLMAKRIWWTGATLRPQSVEAKQAIADGLREQVWPRFASPEGSQLVPHLFAEFALGDGAKAHALMESGQHRGKLVLKVAGNSPKAEG